MATLINSISSIFRLQQTDLLQDDLGVAKPMLLSALRENAAITVSVISKTLLSALAVAVVAALLPYAPAISFYSAFSASLGLIYIASLAYARGFRDAIVLIMPTVLIFAVLGFDSHNVALVGLTLFTHVFLSFTAGFSRAGGSLRDLGLWPVLFGVELMMLIFFVEQILV